MHMADALLSPAVGTTFWAGTAAAIVYASKKLRQNIDDRLIPLMGVLGAFIFAAQMINFTVPGTGSSGHIGGGMILALLLGPHASFLVMASVLTVQALFFADGGLLALGANIWNLGVYPCFIAFPFIYKPLAGDSRSVRHVMVASIVSVVLSLQFGAFSVVVQTLLSGKTELPFGTFVLLMQPIHLGIGVIEGIVTAGVINYVRSARPEILESSADARPLTGGVSAKKIVITILALAIVTGGAFSWFASTHPDGLEWSIKKITGQPELPDQEHGVASVLKGVQEKTSFLPDYSYKPAPGELQNKSETHARLGVDAGTSAAGIIGAVLVLALSATIGAGIRALRRRRA